MRTTLAKFVWAIEHGEALAGRVGAGTLVVVNESGMADTLTLDRVVSFCLARGASVRLVGDDRQLSAVGAGGVLEDIAARHGAVRLEEAVRFTSTAEAAASLALRAGDPGALGFYLDHHRVHIADSATASGRVLAARQHGVRPRRLMLAPTRALVADLNAAARAARLGGHSGGHEALLSDGNRASVGDMGSSRTCRRPHGAYRPRLGRPLDGHRRPGTHHRRRRRDQLGHLPDRPGQRPTQPPRVCCRLLRGRRRVRLRTPPRTRRLDRIEWAGRAYGLAEADAWPTLRSHLAVYAASGHDPAQVLGDAVGDGPLTLARDEAAVVDHRLDLTAASSHSRGPLPWLPGIPSQLLDAPEWKAYLAARLVLVRDLTIEVRTAAASDATGAGVEPYASGLDLPSGLVGELVVWRAAHLVPDSDTRPTGPVRQRLTEGPRPAPPRRPGRRRRPGGTPLVRFRSAPGARVGRGSRPSEARTPARRPGGRGRNAYHLLLHVLSDPLPDDHGADALGFRIADPALKNLPPLWETVTALPRHPKHPPTLQAPGPDRSIRW